ncbi:putative Ig domain-containing protein [Gloeothece verrucosa]|uniref:YD repeat protein n=1 Tax=Gloeothece verrucosa (strain PCC 7822) TaxID=497965 RepID=E0ULS3_GLOV7|nr:putative Ig domain-containing protein [Gloeothece verrucosa]ADN17903.1 YD repeat protein [Gloeothece verrucosa PCC 7822]
MENLEANFFNLESLNNGNDAALGLNDPFAQAQQFLKMRPQQLNVEEIGEEIALISPENIVHPQSGSVENRVPFGSGNNSLSTGANLPNLLFQAKEKVSHTLAQFLAQPDYRERLETTFGTVWNIETATTLIKPLASGQQYPSIEILSPDILLSQGAFSQQNSTIYLSSQLFSGTNSNVENISSILLEELGHYLDAQLNLGDTPGDEGAIFAALIKNINLTPQQQQLLQSEDDSTTLLINNQILKLEQSTKEIIGTSGRDILTGSAENERFIGGQGADLITGGLGNDVFVYQSFRDAGDTIKDFEVGKDKIDLTLVLQSFGYTGLNPLEDGYVQLSVYSGGTVVSLDSDGNGSLTPRPYIYLENIQPEQLTFRDILPNKGEPPTITVSLLNDTGSFNNDRLTSDPTISGQIVYKSQLTNVKAQLNSNPVEILSLIAADGKFTLNSAQLAQINGGSLADENYTLKLTAQDEKRNIYSVYSYNFILDKTAPNLTLDLDPNFDSAPVGDLKTTFETVDLIGTAEANLTVFLGGLGTTANGLGEFKFKGQSLELGNNIFSLSVTDLAGNIGKFNQTIERLAQQINHAPTDLILFPDTLAENSGNNSLVGMFNTQDIDEGDSHIYELISGAGDSDNSAFTIVDNELRIKNSPDFEAKPDYNIRVRTTDTEGLTYEQIFTINITNVNESPTALTLSRNAIAENLAPNYPIGTFTTSDLDAGNIHSYSLVSGTGDSDNSAFTIVGNELRINQSADFETKPFYNIRVKTTDAGGLSYEQTFTVNVINVNEFPIADENKLLIVNEDSGETPLNIQSPTDVDGDLLTITVNVVPNKGIVQLSNGTILKTGETLSINQLENLSFIPNENANGEAGTFSYTVSDGNGGTDAQTISFIINPVNDAPTLIVPPGKTVKEATNLVISGININDIDAENLRISLTVNHGILSLSQTNGLTFTSGDGSGDNTLIFTGTLANLNAALNNLVYRSNNNFSGDDPLTITVNDLGNTGSGGALEVIKTLNITVTALNSPPVADEDKLLTVDQNSGANSLNIKPPTDVDQDLLTITVTAIPEPAKGSIKLGTQTLTVGQLLTGQELQELGFIPANSVTGDGGIFSYTVSDGQGGTDSQTITFNISPVIILQEGTNFKVIHSEQITVPAALSLLRFTYKQLNFDKTDTDFINDAFEVALVDSDGNSLVHTISSGKDAFFNVTEDQSIAVGASATAANESVTLDLSGIPVGTTGKLIFRLVNNDSDTLTSVRISNIEILPSGGSGISSFTPQVGNSSNNNPINFAVLDDVSSSAKAEYQQTSFNEDSKILSTEVGIKNIGNYGFNGSLIVAIKGLSDPNIQVIGADGFTPEGLPYYDFTNLVNNRKLDPSQLSQTKTFTFKNPQGIQFTYELVILTEVNKNPVIETTPVIEIIGGQTYQYDVNATDANGDTLTYQLAIAPTGMTIDPQSGLINWTTTLADIANHQITLQVTDGRGGITQQNYSLSVIAAPPNRPPIFTSIPVVDAYIKQLYQYDANAIDPDQDPLTYSLIIGPNGMTVHPDTGLVEWTPPPALILGDTVLGRIAIAGEQDEFNFAGVAGQRIYIDSLQYSGSYNNWSFDIFSPSGTQIINDDLDGGLLFTLTEDGNYRIVVDGNDDFVGSYAFKIINTALAPVANFDIVISSNLSPGSEDDIYTFRTGGGQKLYFDALSADGSLGWVLYGPGNQVIGSDNNFNDLELNLSVYGDYTLLVYGRDSFTKTVNYSFKIITPDLTTQSLMLDTNITGSISEKGEYYTYTFTGKAGQQLFFDSLGSDFFYGYLYDPNGRQLWQHNIQNDRGINDGLVLPIDGTYTLQIDGGRDQDNYAVTGNYKFRLLSRDKAKPYSLDTDITGTFDESARGSVEYKFSLSDRTYIYFDGQSNTNAWILYGPNGQYISSNNLNSDTEFWLNSGDYYLVTQGYGDANSADYKLRLITPEVSATTPLSLNTTINSNISEKGEQDIYTFTGNIGQRLYFDVLNQAGYYALTSANLYSPSGRNILSRWLYDQDPDPITLTEAGTYRLVIDGNGENTENYSFSLLDIGLTTTINLDTDITGQLEPGRETHFYKFTANAGQRLYFDSLSSSSNTNWTLYNLSNQALVNQGFSDFEYTLSNSDTYFIAVRGYNNTPVDYKFRLITPDTQTLSLTLGSVINSAISEKGEQDVYTFSGNIGQRLYFDVLNQGGYYALTSANLYSPSGRNILSRWLYDQDPDPITLTEAGTYRLVIDGNGENTENYSFSLLDVGLATTINLDTDITGQLEPGRETHFYKFTANAGQRLYFDSLSNSSSTNWTLYNLSNQALINQGFSDFEYTLSNSDTYLIAVRGYNNTPVDYKFRLITPDTQTLSLTLGNAINSAISEKGEQDIYTFSGNIGQRLYFDILNRGGYYSTKADLYSPSGRNVLSRWFYDQDPDPITLTEAGIYRLVIDGNGENTDSYSFNLNDLSLATEITSSIGKGGIVNPANNHTYFLTNSAIWTDARTQAQAKGGYLVTINNAAENQFLVDTFGGSEYLWIGLNDATVEGSFQWDNGEPVTYTNWNAGQPDNYLGIEDYAHLNFANAGRWNDLPNSPSQLGGGWSSQIRGIIEINNTSGVIPATEIFGTLNSAQTTNFYKLSGKAGQTLRFIPTLSPSNTNWFLYNSANKTIINSGANISQTVTLSNTDNYYLGIQSSNSTPVNYQFKIVELNNPNSLPSTDIPLTIGSIVNGTINTTGQTQSYSFNGTVGQQLFYDSLGGNYFKLRFYDPTGREIYNTDSRYDRSFDNGLVLGMNGTYRVTLSEGTGNYSFRFLDKASAISINLDTNITGTLDNGGIESDSYRFTLTDKQYLYFDGQTGNYDNAWILYGAGGQYITSKYFYQSQNSVSYNDAEFSLDAGDYWLVIQGNAAESWTGGSNDYKFRIVTPQLNTAPLTMGTVINGSISETGEQDTYTFTGTAGQQLFYDALGGDYLKFRFYDPTGREIFNVDSRYDRAPHDGLTLALDGTYRVVIDGEGDGIGNYKFRLLDKASAILINLDTDITGTLDNGGIESDSYGFTLTGRQYLYFDGQTGNYDNAWILYGPGGQYITSRTFYQNYNSVSYNDAEFSLDAGDYWLVIQGNAAESWTGGSNDYKLRIVTPQLNTVPMTIGTIISGSISETGEQDAYTFTGTAGQQLFYDALGGDYLKFRFYDPTGREIFNVDSRYDRAPHDGLTLALDGTYRVVIDGEGDGIGNYKFRLLDKGAATVVNLDSDIIGTLDNGGLEADGYRFTLTERKYLYFDGQIGNYDNAWILYGSGGQYITSKTFYQNQNPLYYNDAELWLDPGNYWLVIQGNGAEPFTGGSNDYKLRIVTPELITNPMTLNTDISGTINEKGERDYYTFTGKAGQELFYDYLGGDYLKMYVYDPAGRLIVDTDSRSDRGPDYYSNGLVLKIDGTYQVTVDGEGEGTGNYKFRFLDRTTAKKATLDTDITGTWDNGARGSDAYQFSLTERTYLYFDSQGGAGAWIVYKENGQYVDARDLRNNDNEFWLDAGNYFLIMQGYGDSNNANYKLRIVTPTLNTTPYSLGSVITGSISEKGEQDYYTFEGTAGQRLFFDSLLYTNNTYLSITTPSGKAIVNGAYTRDNRINIILDETGTYRVTFDANGETTENYSFRLLEYGAAFSHAVSQATPTSLNTEISGTFDDPQQRESDFYRFTSTAGQYLYIDTLEGNSPNGWTIFRPNGELLLSGYLYEDKEIRLSDTGEYTLEVWGVGSGNKNYKLQLITPEFNTVAYTLGETITSQITQKGEQDIYTFTGTAGQWLYFDQFSGNSNLKARLYSPTGVVEVDDNTDSDWNPVILRETGNYRLIIDGQGETTGVYSFALRDRQLATQINLGTTLTEQLNAGNGAKLYQINGQAGQVLQFNHLGQIITSQIDSTTGHAYVLTDLPGTWNEAQSMAQSMGGHLVTITSAAENQFLLNQFGSSQNYWIGLSDAVVEGNWRWVNGEPFNYANWGNGEPNNAGNEDYAVFNGSGVGRWNDAPPNYASLRGIVENDGTTPLRTNIWQGANWVLYDPSGRVVANPSANSPDFQYSLASSGVYTLAVLGNSSSPFNYEFQVTDVTPTSITSSGLNQLQSGSLNAGQVINYNFSANAGTLVYLDTQDNSSWQIRYRLLNPDGSFLFSDHDGTTDRLPFNLSQSGQYTLQVFGYYSNTTGNYEFNLLELPKSLASRAANYLEQGSTISGSLNSGETKIYSFEGLQNNKVMLNMMSANGVRVSLYNPNGTQIFSGDYDSYYQWYDNGLYSLAQNGKYYLAVSAFTGANRNYSFQFLTPTEAPEIAYGISEQGTLTPGQASTFYTLQANAGERLFFDIQSTNAPNGNYRWILYGPGNNALFNQELRYNAEVTLTAGGQYTLYLQGGPDATPINYQFRVFNLDQPIRDILTPGSGEQSSNATGALGLFDVKLGVRDGRGGTAVQDYQIRLWPDPENSNPVIISNPETRLALDTKAYRYQLNSIDPDGDPLIYRLLDGPAGAFINGETGELLWFPETNVKPGDKATFSVEVNDRRGGFDKQTFSVDVFGGLGTIRGGVFDDLNGNGFRDTKLIRGDDPALIFTIDVSGSTAAPFRGKGDYENIKTVVDAQVAAAQVLLDAIVAQGAGDRVKVGLILFGSDATIQDLDPTTPGLQQYITVNADADHNGRRDFDQILKTLRPGMIPGGTDIHKALDKIDTLFDVLPGDPNFIFMSDGYDSEFDKARAKVTIDDLKSKGGNITAFAIGEAATTENLKAINPDAIQVVDFDELYNIFFGFDDRYAVEPWLEGVTVYLDLNNNQVLDRNEPFRVTKEDNSVNTLGNTKYYYTFDNLLPGNYTVRVEVPNGSLLTAPPANQIPVIDTVTLQGETFNHLFGLSKISDPPNADPIFLSTPPTKVQLKAGQLLKYDADARDVNGDPLTYQLTFAPSGMTIDPETGIVVWNPTKQQVEQAYQELRQLNQAAIDRGRLDLVQPLPLFNVLISVKDGRGGTALQYLNVELLSDNHLPVFTSIAPENAIAQVGKPFRYQAAAQDPDGDTVTYSLVAGAPAGVSMDANKGLLTWTPASNQLGAREFTIKVADGKGGEALQTVSLVVNAPIPNQAPVITSNPRTSTRTGEVYFYQVQASDPDGDVLTYSLPVAPAGMTINNGLITWQTTAAQSGSQNVTLRVSDGQSFTEQSFSVTLAHRSANNIPIITSSPNTVTNLEQTYSYNLTGQDADGDLLFWSLETAPAGMVIDTQTGALRWLPTSSQLGQHSVIVRLFDNFGAFSTQEYTLTVNGTNTPARIVSTPITRAAINQPYTYNLTATDPENSPLRYSLGRKPNGMTIDSTGKIAWIPTQAGNYDIDLIVTDVQGATTTQTYQLVVGTQAINRAPNITSTPQFVANVGSSYQYQIQASDPDGHTLTYQLVDAPQGMTINANTGLVQWNNPITGNYKVVVAAFDSEGLGVTQGYTLNAKVNSLPVIRSTTPPVSATPGVPYRYDIQATDPDGGSLTYTLDAASVAKGITLDDRGRLSWTPSASQTGNQTITLTITDAAGGQVTQNFNLTVAPDTTAPKVTLIRSVNIANQGDEVFFQVRATDNIGIANLQLLVNNQPILVDANGVARLKAAQVGTLGAKAIATDLAGNKSEATTSILILDATDTEAPTVQLDLSSISNGTITAPTAIRGTINDSTLQYYTLEVAPLEGNAPFKEIWRGTTSVTNGVLGQLDPSLLANDTYRLRVTAYDAGGHISTLEDTISVAGDLKLGNFQLSFTDLEIPVNGIPITLTRTYDTLTANNQDDFGYGWRMEFRDADLRTSVGKDEFFDEYGIRDNGFYNDQTKVYITLPGGKREGFTFRLKEYNSVINAYLRRAAAGAGVSEDTGLYIPSFIPDEGVTSTLTVPTSGIVLLRGDDDRAIPFSGGSAYRFYNPQDWGGYYTLTTQDGIAYQIDAQTGDINSITNTNGNKLSFTDAGITSSTGQQITFERDSKGRITAVIDPLGNKIQYQYDAKGDLIAITDRENNKTEFVYDDRQPHYLEEVIDPLDRNGAKAQYNDEGRLVKLIKTDGNAVEWVYDPDNFLQTVKDGLGNPTTYEYDERGNVITIIDPLGNISQFTYDDKNNLTSETDPLGNETIYTYDAQGNILTKTAPNGELVRYAYDSYGQLTQLNLSTGASFKWDYDRRGNLLSIKDGDGKVINFYTYDNSGRVISEGDSFGTSFYTYDNLGNLIEQKDPNGKITKMEYNTAGNLIKMIDPDGRVATFSYDKQGRKTNADYGEGISVNYSYTGSLNEWTTAEGPTIGKIERKLTSNGKLAGWVAPDGSTLTYEYDAAGRLTKETDPSGKITEYTYDAAGRLIKIKNATTGATVTRDYDKVGRVIKEIDPFGNATTYTYVPYEDEIASVTDAKGNTWTYDYTETTTTVTDPLGRKTTLVKSPYFLPIETRYSDGKKQSIEYLLNNSLQEAENYPTRFVDIGGNDRAFTYDSFGRLKTATDLGNAIYTYAYSDDGLTQIISPTGETRKYSYDDLGNLKTITYDNNTVKQLEYGNDNRLVKVTLPNGETLTYQYDEAGNVTSQVISTGETIETTYTTSGSIATSKNAAGTITYHYDTNGNLQGIEYPNGSSIFYERDVLGRVTKITETASGSITAALTRYTYDEVGNLKTITDPTGGGHNHDLRSN